MGEIDTRATVHYRKTELLYSYYSSAIEAVRNSHTLEMSLLDLQLHCTYIYIFL